MYVKMDHGLTAKQRIFVRTLIESGDRARAVSEAGYGGDSSVVAPNQLRTPSVLAAIRIETAVRLQTLAPVALKVLAHIIEDETALKGLRVDTANTILDRAGFIAPQARDPDRNSDRPLTEFSIEELRALIDDLERQRGDDAKVVGPIASARSDQAEAMLA